MARETADRQPARPFLTPEEQELARKRDEQIAAFDLTTLGGPGEAEMLCERIAATGALEEARELALSIVSEAKASLPASPSDGRRYELLDLLADAVVERYC